MRVHVYIYIYEFQKLHVIFFWPSVWETCVTYWHNCNKHINTRRYPIKVWMQKKKVYMLRYHCTEKIAWGKLRDNWLLSRQNELDIVGSFNSLLQRLWITVYGMGNSGHHGEPGAIGRCLLIKPVPTSAVYVVSFLLTSSKAWTSQTSKLLL